MGILVNEKTRVVVQGITGAEGTFHAQSMQEYGTRITAGVTPGKGGTTHLGVPVFNTVAEAAEKAGIDLRPPGEEQEDITRDSRSFTAAIRTRIFGFLRAWSTGDIAGALAALDSRNDTDDQPWGPERLKAALDAYHVEHERLRLDPEARNLRHTYVQKSTETWRVQQMLVDPEMYNDWVAEFEVDLAASRMAKEPVLRLLRLGSLV